MRTALATVLLLVSTACGRQPSLAGYSETCHAQPWPAAANGRTSASGERLTPLGMTAGHAELPFGTVVRVVNLNGGQEVAVRIIDRVPAGSEARLRLSPRAAGQLGASGTTLLHVRLDVLE